MNRSAPNVELACKTLLMAVLEVRGSGCNWPCHMMEVVNTCLEIHEAKLGRASKKYLDALRRNLATALTEPGAVRKQSRKDSPALSRRAAGVRVKRAVAAGRLVRGPRGWAGIAGDCEPWPSMPPKPPAARPAAPAVLTPMDVRPATRPAVVVAAYPPPAAGEAFHVAASIRAAPPPISFPDLTPKEQTWSRMALAMTG